MNSSPWRSRLQAFLLATTALTSLTLAGCASGKHATASTTTPASSAGKQPSATALPASIPRPNFAAVLPANYRARHVWYQPLSNTTTPDAVITSTGPPVGSLSFHSADLQVLSWDPIAKRWIVAFDAQKIPRSDNYFVQPTNSNSAIFAPAPATPTPATTTTALLDPKADVGVDQVAFVRFTPKQRTDLVFTATTSYGGSGVGSQLNVVDFTNGEANIVYTWDGEGLYPFKITGAADRQQLRERAEFWTLEDPHCCPARTYTFTIAAASSANYTYITDIQDQRPWLGAYVQATNQQDQSSPLAVLGVVPNSPAAHILRRGDIILSIPNAPKLQNLNLIGPHLVDQLALLNAGRNVSLVVRRGSQTLTLNTRLGSMIDSSALGASPPAGSYTVATI